jgi:hypothetical protein
MHPWCLLQFLPWRHLPTFGLVLRVGCANVARRHVGDGGRLRALGMSARRRDGHGIVLACVARPGHPRCRACRGTHLLCGLLELHEGGVLLMAVRLVLCLVLCLVLLVLELEEKVKLVLVDDGCLWLLAALRDQREWHWHRRLVLRMRRLVA